MDLRGTIHAPSTPLTLLLLYCIFLMSIRGSHWNQLWSKLVLQATPHRSSPAISSLPDWSQESPTISRYLFSFISIIKLFWNIKILNYFINKPTWSTCRQLPLKINISLNCWFCAHFWRMHIFYIINCKKF